MSMLFQNMRKTVEVSGLLGDSGQARSTFEYLFDQAVADSALKGGKGWGLASRLEESWSRGRGRAQSTPSPKAIEEIP
jgi:Rod binding domain-containing protein